MTAVVWATVVLWLVAGSLLLATLLHDALKRLDRGLAELNRDDEQPYNREVDDVEDYANGPYNNDPEDYANGEQQ